MKVLQIKSSSMREALAEAKRQLGDQATVLHTKQYEEPAWFGLRRKYGVEVLAAVDAPETDWSLQPASGSFRSGDDLDSVSRQIAEVRDLIARMESKSAPPAPKETPPVVQRLVKNGVPERLAQVLVPETQANDGAGIVEIISRRLQCAGEIDCSRGQARVALVGPTGTGKTTTAAKLAAQYSLVHKKKVALLTLDTYRIGAVEQLSTYARILNLPLEVALCPEDVDPLVRKHRDKDVLIIDTIGRSQRNPTHLSELARMLEPVRPTEVHLVVSSSAGLEVQNEVVVGFSRLATDRLLVTKLDECPQPGCVLHLAATSLLPFSYLTFGQEVPDDIALAESNRLARLVWEGRL